MQVKALEPNKRLSYYMGGDGPRKIVTTLTRRERDALRMEQVASVRNQEQDYQGA